MALDINLKNTLKAVVDEVKTFISGTYLSKSNNLSDVSNRQTALNTLLGADATKTGSIPYVDTTGNIILTNRYESGAGMVANEVSIHDHRNSLVGPSGDVYVPMMYFIHRNSMSNFELEFSVFSVDNQSLPAYYGRFVFNRSDSVGMKFYCLDWVCSDESRMKYTDILAVDSGSITREGLQYKTTTIYRKRSNTPDFAAYCIHSMSTYSFDWSKGYVIPTYYVGGYDPVPLKDGEQVLVTSDLKSLGDLTNPVAPTHQSIQSDWGENDNLKPSFIKNRTHYTTIKEVTKSQKTISFTSDGTYAVGSGWGYAQSDGLFNSFVEGELFKVYIDDALYSGTVQRVVNSQQGLSDARWIGNGSILNSNLEDTGEDWCIGSIYVGYNSLMLYVDESLEGSRLVKFNHDDEIIHALEEKYIPISIPRKSEVTTNLINAEGTMHGVNRTDLGTQNFGEGSFSWGSVAQGYQAVSFGGAADGAHSFSANNGLARGAYSAAFGEQAEAVGRLSVAMGDSTVANGGNSLVYGCYNIADNLNDWTEWVAGTSYNVGDRVKYRYSTDDPYIGYICKTANSDSYFNSSKWNSFGMNYVEIVGNGTGNNARSNARTLDWEGNEWLAGNLVVAGTKIGRQDSGISFSLNSDDNDIMRIYSKSSQGASGYEPYIEINPGEIYSGSILAKVRHPSGYGAYLSLDNTSTTLYAGDVTINSYGTTTIQSTSSRIDITAPSGVFIDGGSTGVNFTGPTKGVKKSISTSSCTPDTYYCPTSAIVSLVCNDNGFTGDYNYTFSGCFTAAAGMTQMPTQTDYQSITMTWYGDIGIEAGERYMFCSTKVSATEYVGVVTKLV